MCCSLPITMAHRNDGDNSRHRLDSKLWLLHPQPRQCEPLTLWMERIARAYSRDYRLAALGFEHFAITELSEKPSQETLKGISQGTGVPISRLLDMTSTSILLQLQHNMQMGIGVYEACTRAWRSRQVRFCYRSDSEYWQEKHASRIAKTIRGRLLSSIPNHLEWATADARLQHQVTLESLHWPNRTHRRGLTWVRP